MRTECHTVGSGDNRVPGRAERATTTWHIIMLPHIQFSVCETPQTNMTEWHTWRMETKADRVTTFIQLERPTKDSFCGKPDWQPVLSLGISAFKMQFNNHFFSPSLLCSSSEGLRRQELASKKWENMLPRTKGRRKDVAQKGKKMMENSVNWKSKQAK